MYIILHIKNVSHIAKLALSLVQMFRNLSVVVYSALGDPEPEPSLRR